MPQRLSDWKRRANRAMRALEAGEWWDGTRWHSPEEHPEPRRRGESAEAYSARVQTWVRQRVKLMQQCYKAAIDVLLEDIYPAMLGTGPVNGAERVRAVRRFERSAQANRDERSASTAKEAEAEEIFNAARSGLTAPRPAWTRLALDVQHKLGKPITANRLRQICRRRLKQLQTT